MNNNVEVFRRLLQRTVDGAEKDGTEYAAAIAATARALLADYNNLFPTYIHNSNRAELDLLIEKYCVTDPSLCPICEGPMNKKSGKYGIFLGCRKAGCGGARSHSTGQPSANQALKNYLSSKEYVAKQNRFSNLELGED